MLAGWLAVNPFVFGKPTHEQNWATRAMLGEELWITQRPKDAATAVTLIASTVAVIGIIAARHHRLRIAAAASSVKMALTLAYWEQRVRYFDRRAPKLPSERRLDTRNAFRR